MKKGSLLKFSGIVVLLVTVTWIISCAVNPVTGKKEFMFMTEADEINLGKNTDQQIIQMYGLYEDPELQTYINTMGQDMSKLTHRPQLKYEFKILDTPVINAFAVPGGYVYFTRGILGYLNNEAELAGVMGHELGHVNARHSARTYSKSMLAGIGLFIGTELSEEFAKYAPYVQFGVSMLFLRFSRDDERQADALGVEYSSKSGYDSNYMGNFFDTLMRLSPGSSQSGLPGWFSTHPNPPDRVNAVHRDTEMWQKQLGNQNFQVNSNKYLSAVDGLVFGEDPRQGYVEDGTFYHPAMRFKFAVPAGWQVMNTPAQVQMVSQKEDAVILFSVAQQATPKQAADSFVQETSAQVFESKALSVNKLSAHRVFSEITSEQSVIDVVSYFIRKDNNTFVFHGYTAKQDIETYKSTFQTTMGKFSHLSDPAKINVEPAHLRIFKTKKQGTLREALNSNNVPEKRLEEFAILNGRQLDDSLPAGTMVKILEE